MTGQIFAAAKKVKRDFLSNFVPSWTDCVPEIIQRKNISITQ